MHNVYLSAYPAYHFNIFVVIGQGNCVTHSRMVDRLNRCGHETHLPRPQDINPNLHAKIMSESRQSQMKYVACRTTTIKARIALTTVIYSVIMLKKKKEEQRDLLGSHDSNFKNFIFHTTVHKMDFVSLSNLPIDDPKKDHHSAIGVIVAIED